MFHPKSRIVSAVLTAGLALGACSFQPIIAEHVIDYNYAVEKVNNELIFANILRAKDRMPMHFTTLTQIRGSFSATVDAGFTLPFGRNPTVSYRFSPSISGSSKPSFDIGILDKQEFMQGFLKPISMDLIDFYWQQGWPKELLMHMFVRKIEDSRNGPPFDIIRNNPGDLTRFQKFLRKSHLRIGHLNDENFIGPVLDESETKNKLEKLAALAEKKIELIKVTGGYRLRTQSKTLHFCLTNIEEVWLRPSSSFPCKTGQVKKEVNFQVRSTEAMIFYLGEIIRAYETDPNRIVTILTAGGKNKEVLFFARKATDSDPTSLVSVVHKGARYVIPETVPGYEKNRSMHVLSLVSQLLALHKKSGELPKTTAVSGVGQ